MSVISLCTKDQQLKIVEPVPIITSGNANNDEIQVKFDETWDLDTDLFACFFNNIDITDYKMPLEFVDGVYKCSIPNEAIPEPCYLKIGVYSVKDGKTIKTSSLKRIEIYQGAKTDGKIPNDSLIDELRAELEAVKAENTELKESNAELTADNETLQNGNNSLSARVDELEASIKPEQEKSIDITENGIVDVLPDENKTLSKVTVKVDVQSSGGTDELEAIIDRSGVLDSTEELTVTDKVEQLIDKAEDENAWYEQSALWSENFALLFANNSKKKLPRLQFDNATNITGFVRGSTIEEIDYYIESPKLQKAYEAFKNTSKLKHIVGIDISKVTSADGFFANSAIEEIDEPLNPISIPSYAAMITFNGCNNLRKITFVAESIKWSMKFTSAVLSDESIISIINGLATVETKQILTVHSDISNKIMTDEELVEYWDIAINKNWEIQ